MGGIGGIGGDPRLRQTQRTESQRPTDRVAPKPGDVAAKRAFAANFEQAMQALERANAHVKSAKDFFQKANAPGSPPEPPASGEPTPPAGRRVNFKV